MLFRSELFDAEAFGITRSEASGMDPQQRLLLLAAHAALEQAGGVAAAGRNIGAYVGISTNDYQPLCEHSGIPISAYSFTASSASVASGRLAYVFGRSGPTASVDTACSASLVATHLAAAAFAESPLQGAIAAGVLLCLVPESTLMLARASMLSPEGRSKTLDATADGYVRGDACRAVYLARADPADPGLAIGLLRATAVNTNGRASSLTAPHGPSQQALLRWALTAARLAPQQVAGLQLHSNGTALGDPIELGAIAAVMLVS